MAQCDSSVNLRSTFYRRGLLGLLLACLLTPIMAMNAGAQHVGASIDWRRCDDGAQFDTKDVYYRLQVRHVQQSSPPVFKATILVLLGRSKSDKLFQLSISAPNAGGRKSWCVADYQSQASPADAQLPRIQFSLEQVGQAHYPAFKGYLEGLPYLSGSAEGWFLLPAKNDAVTYADLIYDYLNRDDLSIFFPSFQLSGFLRVDTLFVEETPQFSRHRNQTGALTRTRLGQQGERDYRTVVRRELIDLAVGLKQSAPPAALVQPAQVTPGQPVQPQPAQPAQVTPGQPVQPQPAQAAQVAPVAGGGLKDYLLKLDSPEFAQVGPDQVRHFGYCRTAVAKVETKSPSTTFKLTGCQPTSAGTIPVKLPGFDVLWIDGGGAAVDARLRVSAVESLPYPSAWKSDRFARLRGGSLAELQQKKIEVSIESQFPECSARHSLTFKEVLALENGGLDIPRTCQDFDVTTSAAIAAARAAVISGCNGTRRVVFQQPTINCWRSAVSRDPTEIMLDLVGFDPIKVALSTSDIESGRVAVSESQILATLKPKLTLGRATEAGLPSYKPTNVQFMNERVACGDLVDWTGKMPTVGEARCTQLPNQIRVRFAIDTEAVEREKLPRRAFQQTLERTYLLDGQPMRPFALTEIARELPVRFVGDKAREYDRIFGQAFANEMNSGVFLYQASITHPDACDPIERARNERFVRFVPDRDDTNRPALRMRWPLTARVVDKDRRALAQCAVGVVQGSDNDPYWTFELKPARAPGKRKLVVIAISPDFIAGSQGVSRQTALKQSLQQLVDRLADNLKKNGQLAPMDIYTVIGADDFVPLFTGEEAAMEPQRAKTRLTDALTATSSNVPDITKFENLMDVKGMSDLIVVMHGGTSMPARDSLYALEALAVRLGKANARLLLSAENCPKWAEPTRQSIECAVVGGDISKIKQALDPALMPKGAN
jgi:hypothetical protein